MGVTEVLQLTRDVYPMLFACWSTVCDAGTNIETTVGQRLVLAGLPLHHITMSDIMRVQVSTQHYSWHFIALSLDAAKIKTIMLNVVF